MNIDEAIEHGIKHGQKKGASAVEGFGSRARSNSVEIEKGKPKISTGIFEGISFRVIANGNMGFGFTRALEKTSIETVIEAAVSSAKAKEKDPHLKSFPAPQKSTASEPTFDSSIAKLSIDEVSEFLTQMTDVAEANEHGLHLLGGWASSGSLEISLKNSLGVDHSGKTSIVNGGAYLLSLKGTVPNYAFEYEGHRLLSDMDWRGIGEKAVEETLRASNPRTKNFAGEAIVIFEPGALGGYFGGLLGVLTTQLQGSKVDRGDTYYADRLGEEVAPEQFSLIDNGLSKKGFISGIYDSEGIPSQRTPLIEQGVLKNFLFDYYYANKLSQEPNGKCVRGSGASTEDLIKESPTIGTTTVEIAPGDSSRDEMIEETQNGFIVKSLMGVHMSDFSSGRFAVTGFGWLIKGGKVKYPVQDISISGTMPELIQKIDLISKERIFRMTTEVPYLRVDSLSVASKKFDFKTRAMLWLMKIGTTLRIMRHPML